MLKSLFLSIGILALLAVGCTPASGELIDPLGEWKDCAYTAAKAFTFHFDVSMIHIDSQILAQREEVWIRCLSDMPAGYEADVVYLLNYMDKEVQFND